jgi:chromosome segregation ATPase
MEWKNVLAVFALLILFAGCISSEDVFPGSTGSSDAGLSTYPGAPAPAYEGGDYSYAESSSYAAQDRVVIQTGSLALKVPEGTLEGKMTSVRGFVSAVGGTYTGISYYETEADKSYYVTVKVPPAKFDEFVNRLKGIGEIKSMDTSLEDVTEQYTDINTRISNLEIELGRLNSLYNRSENISDILAIEREVTRVQTDLDYYKQQKLDLERRSAMSTIQVRVYEEKPEVQTSFLMPLEQLLAIFLGALTFGIMLLAGAIGFLLPLAIVIWILWKLWKHFKGKK